MRRLYIIRNFSDGLGNTTHANRWRIFWVPKGARVCSWFIDVQLPWLRFSRS